MRVSSTLPFSFSQSLFVPNKKKKHFFFLGNPRTWLHRQLKAIPNQILIFLFCLKQLCSNFKADARIFVFFCYLVYQLVSPSLPNPPLIILTYRTKLQISRFPKLFHKHDEKKKAKLGPTQFILPSSFSHFSFASHYSTYPFVILLF